MRLFIASKYFAIKQWTCPFIGIYNHANSRKILGRLYDIFIIVLQMMFIFYNRTKFSIYLNVLNL